MTRFASSHAGFRAEPGPGPGSCQTTVTKRTTRLETWRCDRITVIVSTLRATRLLNLALNTSPYCLNASCRPFTQINEVECEPCITYDAERSRSLRVPTCPRDLPGLRMPPRSVETAAESFSVETAARTIGYKLSNLR